MCGELQSNGASPKSKTHVNKQEQTVKKCSKNKTQNYYLIEKAYNHIQSLTHTHRKLKHWFTHIVKCLAGELIVP